MDQEQLRKVLKQVEYYFSDANLSKDAYLQKLIADNKGCPVSDLNKFQRMKVFGISDAELEELLKTSETLTVANGKIARKTPVPEDYNPASRTLIVTNLPKSFKLEDVESLFKEHADKIARISLRKDSKKNFRGSAFIEMKREEDVPAFMSLSIKAPDEDAEIPEGADKSEPQEGEEKGEEKEQETPAKRQKTDQTGNKERYLEMSLAKEYFAKMKLNDKASKAAEKLADTFKDKIFRYTINGNTAPAKPEDAKGENSSANSNQQIISISEIKQNIKDVAFVDVSQQHIRMKVPTDALPSITIGANELSFYKLDQHEVENYCMGLTLDKKGKVFKPRK